MGLLGARAVISDPLSRKRQNAAARWNHKMNPYQSSAREEFMRAVQLLGVAWVVGVLGAGWVFGAERALLVRGAAPELGEEGGVPVFADVNGDGRADLVAPTGKRLRVFLGQERGWATGAGAEIPFAASEIVVADFNGDRKLDVALATHDRYAVAVLLGDGGGGFAAAAGSPFVSKRGEHPHTHGLAAGDFNKDGKVDLVVANNEDGDVSLMLGDGKGGFVPAPRSPFACGKSPYPIAVADLDGDGNADVLVPNSVHDDTSGRTLTVLRGNGKGELSPMRGSPFEVAGQAFYVTAGDLNGDGKVDVVVTHNNDDGATLLVNDGRGGLVAEAGSPLKLGHNSWGVEVVDMNGDGKADLVTAGGDAVRVFLGDGTGRFNAAPGSPFVTGKGSWRFSVGDFNGDGKLDVVTRCVEERRVVVLVGQ